MTVRRCMFIHKWQYFAVFEAEERRCTNCDLRQHRDSALGMHDWVSQAVSGRSTELQLLAMEVDDAAMVHYNLWGDTVTYRRLKEAARVLDGFKRK